LRNRKAEVVLYAKPCGIFQKD